MQPSCQHRRTHNSLGLATKRHSAKAELSEREHWNAGEGSEILHITGVEFPCGVRYLWTNYTEDIPLFDSENGVPLPPFIMLKPGYNG